MTRPTVPHVGARGPAAAAGPAAAPRTSQPQARPGHPHGRPFLLPSVNEDPVNEDARETAPPPRTYVTTLLTTASIIAATLVGVLSPHT